MAETTQPRRKLIIKICLPRCETTNIAYSPVEESSEIQRIIAKENLKANGKDSRTVSKVCALKSKKGYYAATIWVNAENPSNSSDAADSRTSRTEIPSKSNVADLRNSRKGSEECKLKNKRKNVGVECNKREKKRKMQHPMMMDSKRKKQCWALLKRLMLRKDVWALTQPLVHHNSKAVRKPKRDDLNDIESKIRKWGYSEVDEFAHDIRLVFSYALGYPPKSEVHRTARRISEAFEVSWKRLKEEWMCEERDKMNDI